MGRLIDADALVKRMKNTWDMQDLYLPVHFEDLVEEEPTVSGWISVKDSKKEEKIGKVQRLDRDDVRTADS